MRILVISDTHVPRGAADLPKAVYDAIAGVDLGMHAGDFVEIELLQRLRSLKETVGVFGNMDSKALREALKPKEIITVGAFKIGLIHGYGPSGELTKVVRAEFGKVDAIVFGHAHKPVNIIEGGTLLFNPGSPTDKVFSPYPSYGLLDVTDGGIKAEIVRL